MKSAAVLSFVPMMLLSCASVAAEGKIEWTNVGPGGGGWITAVCESRHKPGRLYAGSDVAGFFVSEDGGRHYSIRNRGMGPAFVASITEHPSNPDIILLSTMSGVYRTDDRGLTWRSMRDGFPPEYMWGHSAPIQCIAWSESDHNRVYAAVGIRYGEPSHLNYRTARYGCVYRSDDAGLTWRMVVKEGDPLLETKSPIEGVSVDPRNADAILVTVAQGVYRSEDGGVNWVRSSDGFPDLPARRIARSASHPDVVYAGFRTPEQEKWTGPLRAGICRSDDGGRTWRECATLPKSELSSAGKYSWTYTQDGGMAVDPRNPDVVWAGNGCWLASRGDVWKSTDGGKSWNRVFSEHGQSPGWIDFWGAGAGSISLSAANPDIFSFGTSGKIYRTDDGGRTWNQRYCTYGDNGLIANSGLAVLCVRDVAPDPRHSGRVYFGFWDVGFFRSDDGGRTMRRSMKGVPTEYSNTCFSIIPAPDDDETLYATFGGWGGKGCALFAKSRDGGNSWTVGPKDGNGWISDATARKLVCLTKSSPHTFACLSNRSGILVSTDSGDTWRTVSTNALPAALGVTEALTSDGKVLYAGSFPDKNRPGAVWRSGDSGVTWERLGSNDLRMGSVLDISARDGKILVGCGHSSIPRCPPGAWYSGDNGKTWRKVLDAFRVASVLVRSDGALIAASSIPGWRDAAGLHGELLISRDEGHSWSSLEGKGWEAQNGGAATLCEDPHDPSRIWAGTGGNSVFTAKVPLSQTGAK